MGVHFVHVLLPGTGIAFTLSVFLLGRCIYILLPGTRWYNCSTVRAPVFGRHQFFGTSEHYGNAHGSLLSGWMNYNYTACCWFPTSSNILILPSQFWQIRFESCWLHCLKCRVLVLLWYIIKLHTVFPFAFCGKKIQHHSFLPYICMPLFFFSWLFNSMNLNLMCHQ